MPRAAELATIDDPAVRARAAEILARPEYARFRTISAEWLRKLLDLFNDWITWISALHARSPGLYFVLLFGLLALTALLITHLVWSLRAAMRSPVKPAGPEPVSERDFAAEARALAERGEFLEASHRLLLASLAHAARSRLVELKPDDGNRAICGKLQTAALDPAIRQRWVELIAHTDALWFGARGQNEQLYAAWRNVYAELTRSVG